MNKEQILNKINLMAKKLDVDKAMAIIIMYELGVIDYKTKELYLETLEKELSKYE